MKLLSLLAASALLAATEATIAQEHKCEAPIKFGGKEFCFKVNKKGIKKSKCNSKASRLVLTSENKLCDGEADKEPNCLVAKGKKYKFSNKGTAVLFEYDISLNTLKAYSPDSVKDKYMQFDKKVKKVQKFHKKQSTKLGISCNVPSGWFKCYHRKNVSFTQEGRVLRPSIQNGWDSSSFSGFLIDEKVNWYSVKLEKFGWYANIGWGPPTASLYNKQYLSLGRSIKGTIAMYQTKQADYSYNAYMYKFLNVGQTESSYRKSSLQWSDGDTIKVEQRVASTVWYRNGSTFISHYWETGDERNLRPAFDIYYTEEKYIVTLGDTVE